MKKNRMMRLASVLLIMTLLSTSVISGTFAKYTTSVNSSDKARVAYWGFQKTNTMTLDNLFMGTYDSGKVFSQNDEDVIAPGTTGSATFEFNYDPSTISTLDNDTENLTMTGPEVEYEFKVEVVDSIDASIEDNPNIIWKLDGTPFTTDASGTSWDQMITAIKNLSGSTNGSGVCNYAPGDLPDAFGETGDTHTISWEWVFQTADNDTTSENEMDAQDNRDTNMGNADSLADCSIQITITATQLD